MKIIVVLMTLVAMAGCASKPRMSIRQVLDTYVGRPESELLSRWGAPSQTYESGKQKYLTYLQNGGAVAMPIMGYTAAVPRSCKVTFTVESETVKEYSYVGNMCQ